MANLYNENSIQSLDPREFCRLRPGVYAGSTVYATQLAQEVFANSLDEYCIGHGNTIKITIKDDIVEVADHGQGFLINKVRPEDGKTIFEASLSVMNTSGKYDNESGVYQGTSLGLNGMGSKLTNFLSHWMQALTYRDGKFERLYFTEGLFEKREVGKWPTNDTGTIIRWQPSEEFFEHTEVEIEKLKNLFKVISCLNPGLTIKLDYNGKVTEYFSKNGLNDLVDDEVKGKELIKNRLSMDYENGKNKIDLVLTYTSNYSANMVAYVNNGETNSGPHISQIKALITREFNKFFKSKGWLKDKDENLSGDDIQEGIYIVFNITAPSVGYDAQTKSRIVKLDMTPFTGAISETIQAWLSINEKDVKGIADKALNARKAREAAQKARESIRNKTEKKKKAIKFDSKLADCYSKQRSKCEIYITEGDSASGNMKTARNNEFQAILPVLGKILNTQKASLDKIQKNAEIMTMIEAFGLTPDPKTMKLTYKPEDLRYGKIIIESDADVDGAHIKNLFYTFIWNFCPQLILDGYVYAGVPPLYRITKNKDEYIYLKDEEALAEYKAKHPSEKLILTRMKGLGEMDEAETEILTDPSQRIIHQVVVEDVVKANKLFEDLMGEGVLPRKEFIKNHALEASYDM